MKEYNNEMIFLKIEDKNKKQVFLDCLNISNSLYYLEKEDILNLSKCSKEINTFANENYFLLRNLLNSPQTQ